MDSRFTIIKNFADFNQNLNEGAFWDWLTGKKETGKPKGEAGVGRVSDARVEEFYKTLKSFADSGKSIPVQARGNMAYSKMVENIQLALSFLYGEAVLPKYGVDGLFGPETAAAILKFNTDTKTDTPESSHESKSVISNFKHWNKIVPILESEVIDISDESTFPRIPMKNNLYFVIHHTAGRGTAHDVVRVLNRRKGGLSVQWIVDLDGKIYRSLPPNSIGAHTGSANKEPQVKNSNAQGVEVIGNDDADIKQRFDEDIAKYGYPRQAEAVRKIIKYLGYQKENIFGHGDVTTRKARDEGKTIKEYVLANWDKPVDLSGFQGPDQKAGTQVSSDRLITTIDADLIKRLIDALREKGFSQADLDKYSKSSKNAAVALSSQEDEDFYKAILTGLGANVTPEKMKFLKAWRQAEGGKALNNPFNTTMKLADVATTDYNSVGVKNYPTRQDGLNATLITIKRDYYKNLVNMLKDDKVTADELAQSDDLTTWRLGPSYPREDVDPNSYVFKVLSAGNVNPPPIYSQPASASSAMTTSPIDGIPMGPKTKYNFDLIPDGLGTNFRSKQLPGNVLEEIIKNKKIKKLIRLNAESGGDGSEILSGDEERKICERNGCTYYRLSAHDGYQAGKGYTGTQEKINSLLSGGNTLIHCAAGADRTGGTVGGYLKTKGWNPSDIWDYTVKYNSWLSKPIDSFYSGYQKYAENFMSPNEIEKRIKNPNKNKSTESSGSSTSWNSGSNFFVNAEGKNLAVLGEDAGVNLTQNKGLGGAYKEDAYLRYKMDQRVYWAVYDINGGQLLAASPNGKENVYGASVPKVCVAAAAFNNNGGKLPSDSDYQKVIKLLVKSDNEVWTYVQNLAGGSEAVNSWAASMGYSFKPARTGGNSVNAVDMCKFWGDVCNNRFKGAENIFKITSSCQTDSSRGRKCMPPGVYMGGKTGTYEESNHDTCWIQDGGKFYSISVFTKLGGAGSDAIAQMFRGLYNEYIQKSNA